MPRHTEVARGRAGVVRGTACCLLPGDVASGSRLASLRAVLTQAVHRHKAGSDTRTPDTVQLRVRREGERTVGGDLRFVRMRSAARAHRRVPRCMAGVQDTR